MYNLLKRPTDCPCTYSKPVTVTPTPSAPSSNYAMPVMTTATVSTYVTVCPSPTTFTQGSSTYAVTSATTLTITSEFTDLNLSCTQLTLYRLPLHHQLHHYTSYDNCHGHCLNVYHLLPKPNHYCHQQSDVQCYYFRLHHYSSD
jgi:hypothetical protein